MRHVTSVEDFKGVDLLPFFRRALAHRTGAEGVGDYAFSKKVLATVFYEPSTRTRLSFESAMHGLGGRIISVENAKTSSSDKKGETLEDAVRVIAGNCDVIVLRHPEAGAAYRAAQVSSVPVINAGDGANQHPTQALLDLFTIWEAVQKGDLPTKDLRLFFYGDNEKSRTVHSLCRLVATHARSLGIDIRNVVFGGTRSTNSDVMSGLYAELANAAIYSESIGTRIMPHTDIVYLTRLQKERYPDGDETPAGPGEAEVFTLEHAQLLPQKAIIMHPLPRVDELGTDVDTDHRAWYFKQAANGRPVRMALLERILRDNN